MIGGTLLESIGMWMVVVAVVTWVLSVLILAIRRAVNGKRFTLTIPWWMYVLVGIGVILVIFGQPTDLESYRDAWSGGYRKPDPGILSVLIPLCFIFFGFWGGVRAYFSLFGEMAGLAEKPKKKHTAWWHDARARSTREGVELPVFESEAPPLAESQDVAEPSRPSPAESQGVAERSRPSPQPAATVVDPSNPFGMYDPCIVARYFLAGALIFVALIFWAVIDAGSQETELGFGGLIYLLVMFFSAVFGLKLLAGAVKRWRRCRRMRASTSPAKRSE